MSFVKEIELDAEAIWAGIEKIGSVVFQVIEAVIVDEYQIAFKQEILPLIKQAAVNLQNESPGLDAKTFIPAIVAAVVPLLPVALKDVEETAIFAITSTVSGLLGISNTTGNAGVLPGGTDTTPSA